MRSFSQPFLCAHSNTLQPASLLQITFLASIPLHATLTTMIKAQRNESAIQTQEHRIEQGLPVRDEDRPVPLTKSGKNHLIRSHSTVPVQVKNVLLNVFVQFERRENRSMVFVCVCRKPFLTRDSLSKHYKRVCAHSNIPTNVPRLQLIDSAQVLPDDLEVVNASEEQRTLFTAMEQWILSSIAQTAAGRGQVQAASTFVSDTGPSSPVSTSRKRTCSDAPHFGTFRPPSRMSPTENK
ncbi:hypothetical protein BC939DRAFT_467051 [Gamsiella multidivaricata]|uniref:uncharacterized protein n=1 Tax=Gamsiella multidivaricata TaxID=101098 RepID=UPI00221FDF6C|nr:uncharacterized protein BC939DRAFT_467051 [Gamsiella multidivaricata]KAI7817041.1 hypothetical protein BC939DRAFT_467051 [Gamsiella multidivaricata]